MATVSYGANSPANKLKKLVRLGGGTYGRVYLASDDVGTTTGVSEAVAQPKYAVKRNFITVELDNTIGTIRELDMLRLVRDHPYCVKLINASIGSPFSDPTMSPPPDRLRSDKLFFILEKGSYDGEGFIHQREIRPSVSDKKLFAINIALGLEFLHSRGIYHRDLKPANIICYSNSRGELESAKLTDFGLSQYYNPHLMSVPGCVTLWYRAPEISMMKDYGLKIDVWAYACILYELFSHDNSRFVEQNSDESFLNFLLGKLSFSDDDYMLCRQLHPKRITVKYEDNKTKIPLLTQLLGLTEEEIVNMNGYNDYIDCLSHILVVDDKRRWSISKCLNHTFFSNQSDIIRKARRQFGINDEGKWVTQPLLCLDYVSNSIRKLGMQWFTFIYNSKTLEPINKWYTHEILFHAIEMFDRFLITEKSINPAESVKEYTVVIWINTFIFISTKYFRLMGQDFGLNSFSLGIDSTQFLTYCKIVQEFEEYVVRDIFQFEIYRPTIYDYMREFCNERIVSYLLDMITKETVSSGTPYYNISLHLESQVEQMHAQTVISTSSAGGTLMNLAGN